MTLRSSCLERINAILALSPIFQCFGPRLGKTDLRVGAKPHISTLPVHLKPEDPRFRAASRNAQIKTRTVVQYCWPPSSRDVNCRQLSSARHRLPSPSGREVEVA